jgi:hypothetical protein
MEGDGMVGYLGIDNIYKRSMEIYTSMNERYRLEMEERELQTRPQGPEPQKRYITILEGERYDLGDKWPPEGLMAFAEWLSNLIEEIPCEHRASATIEIRSESGYEDSHQPAIEVRYTRPETADEVAARVTRERERATILAERQERKEREQLALLKQKYGS